jgi:hypothetical protein
MGVGGSTMARGESSLGKGSQSMGRTGSGIGADSTNLGKGGSSMGRGGVAMGVSGQSMAPSMSSLGGEVPFHRTRHLFLHHPAISSSPLTSAPMTTIPSTSEHSSSGPSRQTSDQGEHFEQGCDHDHVDVASVYMTRSNSLPVLTLRELDALKEKDGELGIARGGGWAWVNREDDVNEDDDE